jgi:hypothetical protein
MDCFNLLTVKVTIKQPLTGLYKPLGLQEIQAPRLPDNRHMTVARSSVLRIDRLYPQEVFQVLICIRGWVDHRAIERQKGLS